MTRTQPPTSSPAPTPSKHLSARVQTAVFAALCTIACTTADDAGVDTDADTSSSDGETAGETGTDGDTVDLVMTFQEFGTTDPIVGASVSVDGAAQTTDAAGQVTVALAPNTTSAIDVTQVDFPDHVIYVTTLAADLSGTYDLGSDATLATLASGLGLTRDPSKGLLSIGVLDGTPGDAGPLADAKISVDAASEAQLVFDSSAAAGFSVGDTTLAGSSSASILVNVTPGTITPTITPPAGYTCTLGPETVEVAANGYTIVNYYCGQ